ncbi:golgin subfamily A member 4-like isoform X2 [Ruditapes philippinarum]|uniref:golgin subfamily A member 4-like isoform X2 n=1 Tax=Ruditapes philippinarum TaxID=129788 RepID=UPI00295C290A|nr:golgin subfamily A member 4-like isoform X2 [Ruditapes philippinarum]
MSNVSLGGNTGSSINFDAAALQTQQEDEYRKEEEQQQNELRALLTNAFDDLIDDDDILSITSDDGTDSRNVSLVRRHSNDSLSRMVPEENKLAEQPEEEANWRKFPQGAPGAGALFRQLPQSRYAQMEPLSRTQELPRGQFDLVRASVESLPNFPTNQNGLDQDINSNPSLRSSRDHLDSDYHSNAEDNQNADFHGNVYPIPLAQGHHGAAQGHCSKPVLTEDHQAHHHSNQVERDNILRQSIEDFSKFKEAYQSQEHLFTHHAPVGHDSNIQGHQHYHAAEHPYDQGHGGQGHYYHHDQGQPVYHHGYEGHHHFQNIYQDRPYHTIGEREEAEGGNAHQGEDMHYYQHGYTGGHIDHGFHGNQMLPQGQGHEYNLQATSQDHGFHSHNTDKNEHYKNQHSKSVNTSGHSSSSSGRKLPQVTYRFQSTSNEAQDKQRGEMSRNREKEPIPQKEKTEAYVDNYKVRYEKEHERKREEISQREKEGKKAEKNMDAEFMGQAGNGENQQLAQLQILYKARGRKIEELTNEIEVVKSESGRELRILKHQLSVAKGEKEGSSKSLDNVQSLYQEAKNENAQLVGRVHACESQIEGLKKGKEELIKKLQTAESTIETLHQHLEELGSSDTLTRARHDHEAVVGGLQKKYETEIKHLQENNEKLKQTIHEKNDEITILKQKLTDSIKASETAQISRAETINRLTQSLEESQKRCRNLLEASSSQEMSQMKIHLQQALASRSISDEMCSSLQDEIQDLKEQVQMLESASHLGVSSVAGQTQSVTATSNNFVDQNDSMADLGIRKTLDYDTPQSSPPNSRSHNTVSSNDIVASLKIELERCLVSNKQKRAEVSDLKEEMRKVKKDMMEFRQRCERAELLTQEQKRRIADLESCMSPGDKSNAVENRLKKDVENLKREKKILLEDTEELQKRLEEISKSEERLTELNRELSKQISDMVKEYDQDKREAVERAHRASEQVAETSKNKLKEELTLLFDAERSDIITKYESECNKLREELVSTQEEMDKVKEEYVKMCEEKDKMRGDIHTEWQGKLESSLQQVKDSMKKETELSVLRAEENWAKQKEVEIKNIKEELTREFNEEQNKLKDNLQETCVNEQKLVVQRLEAEHSAEMKAAKERFEAELKTMKDILEMEKSNDLEKLDKEKVNEIEKLKKVIIDKELYLSEKEQAFKEKEIVLTEKDNVIESLKLEHKTDMESVQSEMKKCTDRIEELEKELKETREKIGELEKELGDKSAQLEQLVCSLEEKDIMVESLKSEIETLNTEVRMLEKSRQESRDQLEKLRKEYEKKIAEKEVKKQEAGSSVENILKAKTDEVNRLKKELEKRELEKESEIEKWRREELERTEVDNLRKEIDKNIKKDRQTEVENLKKEVIHLKLEIERLDNSKQMEVDKVCRLKQAEIDNIEKRKKIELEKLKKEKQVEIERLLKEKEEEIKKIKSSQQERTTDEVDITEKVRERLNKELEEDMSKTIETKVAMSKVVWLEEHRATRQAAIDNAVRLAETELRLKMEDDLESKLEARLEEAKILWQSDSMAQLDEERKNWDMIKDEEIVSRLEQERNKWRQTELLAELETERQKWSKELEQRLEEEKDSWREFELETEKLKWASDWERKLLEERDAWVKNTLEPAKRKLKMEAEERLRLEKENWRCMELETEKLKLMREYEERIAQEKQTFTNKTMPEVLEREKNKWRKETEDRLKKEKDQWRNTELTKEIDREKEKWFEEVEGKLREERNNWKNSDLPEEIEKERRKWMKLMEQTLIKEKENWKNRDLPSEIQRVKESLKQSAETELESRLVQKLEVEKEKLQKVNLAVDEARDDWNREYMMKMSINTTSAEASQGLLKEEIDNLKSQLKGIQTELIEKEASWMKEKEDILLQKDLERRQALDLLQEQTENEYKQFLEEHKDMLDKALKAAREQHNKDKAELEERYTTQLKIFQAREKSLQEQLQQSMHGTQHQHDTLVDFEKEQVMWYDERDRLLQEISDRDSLLGKADVHLSKEVDKLRSELQAAYQRRLEGEMGSYRQKLEAEFTRANNSEQKEKLQLEKQLSEVNTELNRLKAQLKEERGKHAEEVKKITNKLNEIEKNLEDKDRLEGELKKAKELLKGFKEELTDQQEKCGKYKTELEDVTAKLNKSLQNQDKLQTELKKFHEEKSTNIESVQSIEASYRKDVSLYKQKLEESNIRISKTEKLLQDMKHKYRAELESLRKALEAENDVAMNAMKNKMIELQKKHVAIVEEMRRKHLLEREELMKHGGQSAVGRGVTPTPNTGEVEEIDLTVKELRSQYLDTVAKIKGDVLRHITQTNVRAAETVKLEMDKERMTTFQQIKDFYRQNVKQILDTEIVGATLESKLLAVEEALENLSSNPSSRSATPKSDEFILDERQMKSRSRSASRDAGISPKGQRSVSFTSGTKGDRSRTPVNSTNDLSMSSQFDDPRSPKSRHFTKSPRELNITVRGDRSTEVPDLRSSYDWKYEDNEFDTRRSENRPTSARTTRELKENDTRARDNRPLSAKSPRELHLSLRHKGVEADYEEERGRERNRSGDKRRSRTLISTRDIHAGRFSRTAEGGDVTDNSGYYGDNRAKSVTPMHSSMSRSSPSLYRPVSVPDLSSEDKELKVWAETNNDSYRYTPLRETLRQGTNLHRSNSKSESDLSIAEKNFGPLKPEYDSNLDLSTGSLTSDSLFTPRKRDAGETPTSTPRRHSHRKHYTLHSFPTRDQITSDLRNREQSSGNEYRKQTQNISRNDDVGVNSPVSSARTSKKNLPLIQFRHGKMQSLGRGQVTNSKSPHPEDGVIIRDTPPTRDTSGSPEKHYRPLSVSTNTHMDF